MTRRAKVGLWAAAVVVVASVVGALVLSRPPVPFEFMKGARLENVYSYSYSATLVVFRGGTIPSSGTRRKEATSRTYYSLEPFDSIVSAARRELVEKGWSDLSPHHYPDGKTAYFIQGDLQVVITEGRNGRALVHTAAPTTRLDRFQSWWWDLTHEDVAPKGAR